MNENNYIIFIYNRISISLLNFNIYLINLYLTPKSNIEKN